MITFSKIGRKGNLGNQLFQIASTIGLAVENNEEYAFSAWQYQQYFKNKLPVFGLLPANLTVRDELTYSHHHWDFTDKNTNYDLNGWLQTEKYFDKPLTKFYFEFTEALTQRIREKYSDAFSKKTILISIRRGDFVDHPDYFQSSISYYMNSLSRYFPDWRSQNLIVLSDDINYCKFHFSFLENAWFGDGLDVIEQFCLGSMCDDFIIGNSTFSWWSAWLGEKTGSTVIRPAQNFDGEKGIESDDKDYFPERWERYDHRNEKVALEDLMFYFPFENNEMLRQYILHYFDTKISDTALSTAVSGLTYVFKKSYLPPPILVLFSYLKASEDPHSIVINNASRIFSISKILNYSSFLRQVDFGMFSRIFSFVPVKFQKESIDIYVKDNSVPEDGSASAYVIACAMGSFVAFGGYKFSVKSYLKQTEIMIKSAVKKLLRIKK